MLDEGSYWDEEYVREGDEWANDDPCARCGPWCPDWGGDGLCMVVIKEQGRLSAIYEKRHVREDTCPYCLKPLTAYDVYAGDGELWSWSTGWFFPILGIQVLGPLWLRKFPFHDHTLENGDRTFHVCIEWGPPTGWEERLIRYLAVNPYEGGYPK